MNKQDAEELKRAICEACNGCPPFGVYGSCWILAVIDRETGRKERTKE